MNNVGIVSPSHLAASDQFMQVEVIAVIFDLSAAERILGLSCHIAVNPFHQRDEVGAMGGSAIAKFFGTMLSV